MKLLEMTGALLPAATAFPATGNTESSTYIIIIAVAGVLLVGAAVAGVITKKKK